MREQSKEELGLAVAKALRAVEPSSDFLRLTLEGAGEGWACCSMVVRPEMLNGLGTCHGGFIFTLADNAFAWACNSRNVKTFAQAASISFLSPGRLSEKLVAEAREESVEGRTGVYTVRVTGEDDRVVAVFQGLSRTAGGAVVENIND